MKRTKCNVNMKFKWTKWCCRSPRWRRTHAFILYPNDALCVWFFVWWRRDRVNYIYNTTSSTPCIVEQYHQIITITSITRINFILIFGVCIQYYDFLVFFFTRPLSFARSQSMHEHQHLYEGERLNETKCMVFVIDNNFFPKEWTGKKLKKEWKANTMESQLCL